MCLFINQGQLILQKSTVSFSVAKWVPFPSSPPTKHCCSNLTLFTHQDLYALLLHWCFVIGGFTYSDQCVHPKLLQLLRREAEWSMWEIIFGFPLPSSFTKRGSRWLSYLSELVESGVGGVVCDEEFHAVIGNLNSGRAVHVGKTSLKQLQWSTYNSCLFKKNLWLSFQQYEKINTDKNKKYTGCNGGWTLDY